MVVGKKELEFELFYKALQPALLDYGIELDLENTKKLVKCILSLIGLFCYKNPKGFFKVGKFHIYRNANIKSCIFTANIPAKTEVGMRDRLQKEFEDNTISNKLKELIKSYFIKVSKEDNIN